VCAKYVNTVSSAVRALFAAGNVVSHEQDTTYGSPRLTSSTTNSTTQRLKDATVIQATQKRKHMDKLLARICCDIQTASVIQGEQAAEGSNRSGIERAGSRKVSEPKIKRPVPAWSDHASSTAMLSKAFPPQNDRPWPLISTICDPSLTN